MLHIKMYTFLSEKMLLFCFTSSKSKKCICRDLVLYFPSHVSYFETLFCCFVSSDLSPVYL